MIDCGEGTQLQLRKSRLSFSRLGHIFISHLHGDHCFGLPGLISTFGLLGRTAPLDIFAPCELERLLRPWIDFHCGGTGFEIRFHTFDTRVSELIFENRSLKVTTIPLRHRMPCSGFLFEEKSGLPHIRRDMMDYLKIPVCEFNNIKLGADWILPDGTVVPIWPFRRRMQHWCVGWTCCSMRLLLPRRKPDVRLKPFILQPLRLPDLPVWLKFAAL